MTGFVWGAALLLAVALAVVWPVLAAGPPARRGGTVRGLGLGLLFSLAAAGLYLGVGSPQAVPTTTASGDLARPAEAADGADAAALRARLEAQPEDVDGWRRLARLHERARRFPEALAVYQRLVQLRPRDPDLWLDHAVALAMVQGERLAGEPERLIERALGLAPNHVQALALSGSARMDAGDPVGAARQWRRLLALVPPDSDVAIRLNEQLAQAQADTAARVAGEHRLR